MITPIRQNTRLSLNREIIGTGQSIGIDRFFIVTDDEDYIVTDDNSPILVDAE